MNEKLFPEKLSSETIVLLQSIAKACRRSILEMVKEAQSGHPGGSLSSIDYLTVLYSQIISQTGEKIVISNGHISPAVYSILAEIGYIPKEEVIKTFRKIGSIYEGHVTRHVPGVWYGTGPLGIGVSVGSGFALAEKLKATIRDVKEKGRSQGKNSIVTAAYSNIHEDHNGISNAARLPFPSHPQKVFGLMGDGEAQEGQGYEMLNFARKYELDNFILFVDYNEVQLSASLEEIMPLDLKAIFEAGHWHVIEIDGHDYQQIWQALREAYQTTKKPVVIIGKTIMGKGVDFMEGEGRHHKATWHGNAPKPEQADEMLKTMNLTPEETALIDSFKKTVQWKPEKPAFPPLLSPVQINTGKPILYTKDTLTDCRSAYGMALLDLAKLNPHVIALTADLRGSVMTKFLASEYHDRHIECGIAEQHMVSLAGGLSLDGFIPFASTFGAFMSSRAKDQARVNDINQTNVKMVATHCGLSVGEDGPTHQAIDDAGSFLGMFNTMVVEPADPNQTDRIIRYIASHWGNFYVRMGRHKFPIITHEDGTPFYDERYVYEYGRCDVIREGKDLTIAATGAMVTEALKARENLKKSKPNISVEIVAISSIKKFDQTLVNSLKKTQKVITVEDHNALSGLGSQLAKFIADQGLKIDFFKNIAVKEYQLSGKVDELYAKAGISAEAIEKLLKRVL